MHSLAYALRKKIIYIFVIDQTTVFKMNIMFYVKHFAAFGLFIYHMESIAVSF